jgi:hypothetical protein
MATKLRKLKIDRVDLVARGANQEAEVLLFKSENGGPASAMDELCATADALVRIGRAADRPSAVSQMMNGGAYRDLLTEVWREGRAAKSYSGPSEKTLYGMVEHEAQRLLTAGVYKTFADALDHVVRTTPGFYSQYSSTASRRGRYADGR